MRGISWFLNKFKLAGDIKHEFRFEVRTTSAWLIVIKMLFLQPGHESLSLTWPFNRFASSSSLFHCWKGEGVFHCLALPCGLINLLRTKVSPIQWLTFSLPFLPHYVPCNWKFLARKIKMVSQFLELSSISALRRVWCSAASVYPNRFDRSLEKSSREFSSYSSSWDHSNTLSKSQCQASKS